jgi:hypothetical protein
MNQLVDTVEPILQVRTALGYMSDNIMTEQQSQDYFTYIARAAELIREVPYFGTFRAAPDHLAAWLRYQGLCVYCESDLFASADTLFGTACTDHLLPRSPYKELTTSYHNAVPSCHRCNWLKGGWDPNTQGKPRYVPGSAILTDEDHRELLRRARVYVRQRLQRDAEFLSIKSAFEQSKRPMTENTERLTVVEAIAAGDITRESMIELAARSEISGSVGSRNVADETA